MPNHVDQKLTIVGPDDAVRAFVDRANGSYPSIDAMPGDEGGEGKRSVLCFHAIVPLPDAYSRSDYTAVGYDMECNTWGVKWGAYDEKPPVVGTGFATYEFRCAWGPPTEFVRRASIAWPTLRFFLSYGGEGPCAGRLAFVNGECTDEEDPEYDREDYPTMESVRLRLGDAASDEEVEDAWCNEYDVAEHRYIAAHDEWVATATAPTGGSSGR